MKCLIIDTSQESGLVALCDNVDVYFESFLKKEEFSSLAVEVEKALRSAKGDIEGIVLGIGPGSYTGLRVGASLAFGVQYAKKIPVFGVSSLEALFLASGAELALTDARSRGVAGFLKARGHFLIGWDSLDCLLSEKKSVVCPFLTERQKAVFSRHPDLSVKVAPLSAQALFQAAKTKKRPENDALPEMFYFDQLSLLKLEKPSVNI